VRIVLVLVAAAAIGIVVSITVGNPFAKDPVTKADIEHAVSKKVHGARVNLTLCNVEFVPSKTPQPKSRETWTCDTYLGRSLATQRNGPSYRVVVDHGEIQSIRRVPPL
jgi:Na+/glutamate symporter